MHIQDRLALNVIDAEFFVHLCHRFIIIFRTADDVNNAVDIIQSDLQTFQEVSTLFIFVEIIFRPSSYDVDLMIDVILNDLS